MDCCHPCSKVTGRNKKKGKVTRWITASQEAFLGSNVNSSHASVQLGKKHRVSSKHPTDSKLEWTPTEQDILSFSLIPWVNRKCKPSIFLNRLAQTFGKSWLILSMTQFSDGYICSLLIHCGPARMFQTYSFLNYLIFPLWEGFGISGKTLQLET